MVEIGHSALARRAFVKSGNGERLATGTEALSPLAPIADEWRALAGRVVEPNGYYLPDWELAVSAFAPGRTGASALNVWRQNSAQDGTAGLLGLLPVTSLWRDCKIPLPALVSADPYGTLGTPLLDRHQTDEAAAGLLQQARLAGARALILRNMSLDGPAMKAITEALRRQELRPVVLHSHRRALLDATRDGEDLLRDALGAKKLKELRRQRNRLAEHGEVQFEVARAPQQIAAAVEIFLGLEASGWKARRGTALLQVAGDASFIRRATLALAERGQCEIVTLRAGSTPVASAVVLRHQDRAFYFKLGVDEHFAKLSPGVQLTLDLTRYLCADPAIATVDSTASPDHPMINPIWRGRLAIGDVLIPLRRGDPVVPAIHAALALRMLSRTIARRAIHFARGR